MRVTDGKMLLATRGLSEDRSYFTRLRSCSGFVPCQKARKPLREG